VIHRAGKIQRRRQREAQNGKGTKGEDTEESDILEDRGEIERRDR
jgi:hypothetical protein